MKGCGLPLMLACGLLAAGAQAQPPQSARSGERPSGWLLFGGTKISAPSGYSYIGALKPFEGAGLGQGSFHRTIASWLSYEYETTLSGQRRMVKARAPGIETGWGHAWKQGATQMEVSLSVGLRHTSVDPDEADSDVRGTRASLTPQVALQHPLSDTVSFDALASYAIGPKDRFARARLISTAWAPGWRVGGELSHQEGGTYRNVSAGLFASKDLAGGIRLEMGAGQTLTMEGDNDPYLALAFSWVP